MTITGSLLLLVASCSAPAEQHQVAVVNNDSLPLSTDTVSRIPDEVIQLTIQNINRAVHPKHGLWIVSSNGAMPQMTFTSQVDKNFPFDLSKMEDATAGGFPQVDCSSKSLWTREGCFSSNSDLFSDSQLWEHSNLSPEEKEKVIAAASGIKWSVVNTAYHARYYFAMIDGKWYLVVADLRRPCEA